MKNHMITSDLLQGFSTYRADQAALYQQAGLWEYAPLCSLLSQGAEQYRDRIAVI
ncbi:2,3-dihydroxybenzoate-AMP ligase, partial [Vibrio anguillarum]|nr:2,3-dihydroxybenzoate-AMP ligase [Vibrio anguillarum]